MNIGLIFFTSLLYCTVELCDCWCGRPKMEMSFNDNENEDGGRRIVGGTQARPHSHAWIVKLVVHYKGQIYECAGSLIRVSEKNETDIVATAAHCVYDIKERKPKWEDKPKMTVTAGVHILNLPWWMQSYKQTEWVMDVVYHKDYPESGVDSTDDMAVLILRHPIQFTDAVQPVCLPTPGDRVQSGTDLIVAGWGHTKENGTVSNVLLQVILDVRSYVKCLFHAGVLADSKIICAGGHKNGFRDSCQGDSGGPAVERKGEVYVLQGIVSFGYGCAKPGYPGGYTRVSTYVCWIYRQVKQHSEVYKSDPESGDRAFQLTIAERGSGVYNALSGLYSNLVKGKEYRCKVE